MTDSRAAWPDDAWWQRYGDPQLDRLMDEALQANPSLRIAAARLRQAQALAGVADAARAPQVNATVKSMRQEFSANSTVPKPLAGSWTWLNDASVGFSYELDFWGKNEAALEAAVGRTKAAEADAHAARLLLTVSVVQAYLKLDQLHAQLELAQATLTQRGEILRLTRDR
ncbi:fusaric acid resistance protein, partial [Oxalobacteraceae bacterium OM1]